MPASVTCVQRSSEVRFLRSLSSFSRRVRHSCGQPKRGEVLEVLEFFHARVRHVCLANIKRGEVLEVLSSFRPASVTFVS